MLLNKEDGGGSLIGIGTNSDDNNNQNPTKRVRDSKLRKTITHNDIALSKLI